MSLQLLQGYSSEEEEDRQIRYDSFSEDDDSGNVDAIAKYRHIPEPNLELPSGRSSLPSVHDAFSEIACPPQFLNNSLEHAAAGEDENRVRYGSQRNHKRIKDLPAGVVLEAKAQLVGIRERVRSDEDHNVHSSTPTKTNNSGPVKRVAVAANPTAEDAAELLSMCTQCGIPKTYSHARGVVCPVCGDRPLPDPDTQQEKKGPTTKEKEKSKRMKGQSSHATWKSETEMLLRQQFD